MDCPLCGQYTFISAQAIVQSASIFDAGGAGCACRIFVNDLNPTWQTKFADLVEGSWPGYASLPALKKWTVTGGPEGGIVTAVLQESIFFASTGPTSPSQTAFGAYLTQGTNLLCAYRFPTPILVADATVVINPQFILEMPIGVFDANLAC